MNNTEKLIKKLEKEYEKFISKIKYTGIDNERMGYICYVKNAEKDLRLLNIHR